MQELKNFSIKIDCKYKRLYPFSCAAPRYVVLRGEARYLGITSKGLQSAKLLNVPGSKIPFVLSVLWTSSKLGSSSVNDTSENKFERLRSAGPAFFSSIGEIEELHLSKRFPNIVTENDAQLESVDIISRSGRFDDCVLGKFEKIDLKTRRSKGKKFGE